MKGPVRITDPLLDVLEVLLEAFRENRQPHGWAIMKAVGRSGPTVYGVLDRLEDAGWVTSQWEQQHPQDNKPRRRFYQLTPSGTTEATGLLARRRPTNPGRSQHQRRPDWGLGAVWRGMQAGGVR
ncbi:PadR family transcriptional regulator [Saccharopolyspora shandongensis]|uniref:PadR family transcriptional regulator n=1 Tax=Saccharopolyspora shandongensis TaxID=418495 RepID=UPI003414E5BA